MHHFPLDNECSQDCFPLTRTHLCKQDIMDWRQKLGRRFQELIGSPPSERWSFSILCIPVVFEEEMKSSIWFISNKLQISLFDLVQVMYRQSALETTLHSWSSRRKILKVAIDQEKKDRVGATDGAYPRTIRRTMCTPQAWIHAAKAILNDE